MKMFNVTVYGTKGEDGQIDSAHGRATQEMIPYIDDIFDPHTVPVAATVVKKPVEVSVTERADLNDQIALMQARNLKARRTDRYIGRSSRFLGGGSSHAQRQERRQARRTLNDLR